MADKNDILDFFSEEDGFSGFKKDDKIVMARVFLDKAEAQISSSILRVEKIPHYIADSNATLFTENILGGERLFVRKEDLERVGELLKEIKERPFEGEEDWYEETRTKQGYKPYEYMTYIILALIVIVAIVFILLGL